MHNDCFNSRLFKPLALVGYGFSQTFFRCVGLLVAEQRADFARVQQQVLLIICGRLGNALQNNVSLPLDNFPKRP